MVHVRVLLGCGHQREALATKVLAASLIPSFNSYFNYGVLKGNAVRIRESGSEWIPRGVNIV
jgi:hypothetical protein